MRNHGPIQLSLAAVAAAMPTFRRIIPLLEQLQAEFPDVANYRKMLVQSMQLYAAGQRLSGDWRQAADTEQKTVAIFERLLSNDPQNVEFVLGLAGGLEGVGKSFHKGEDFEQALASYERAIQVLEPAVEPKGGDRPVGSELCGVLDLRVHVFERLGRHHEAIGDLSRIVELTSNSELQRLKRARLRAVIGQHGAGAAEARDLLDGEAQLDKVEFYNAACVFALAATAATEDHDLSEDRRKTLIGEYTAEAVDCLHKAKKSGHFRNAEEIEHLSKDADFDAVRRDTAFVDFEKSLAAGMAGATDAPES
jgi:tetratricopeptide (TPR) repeat protein